MTDSASDRPDLTLEQFVDRATRSVLAGQQKLDRSINPNSQAGFPGQELVYSFPRAAFAIESAIVMDKKRVLFRRRSRTSTLFHRLSFDLIAVPEPPTRPTQPLTLELAEPAFLLSRAGEQELLTMLIDRLRDPAGWWIVDQPTTKRLLTKNPGLTEQIRRLADQLSPELMVFFRLTRGRFLAARVQGMGKRGEKGKRDSLFVIDSNHAPQLTIYTFPKDPFRNRVSYRPFHDLATIARRWIRGELAAPRSPWQPSDSFGFEALDGFVQNLSLAYNNSLETLADQQDDSALPSFYDLTKVQATLSFSVDTSDGRISFRERFEAENQIAERAATSRVVIRATRRKGHPKVFIELDRIEFLPRGSTREALIDLVLASRHQIALRINTANSERYLELFENPELRRGAVVFRSLQIKKVGEELIVVWPGRLGAQPRDFVFACERTGNKIHQISKIMALEENLDDVMIDLSGFGAFHRFFAAVRLWRDRGIT